MSSFQQRYSQTDRCVDYRHTKIFVIRLWSKVYFGYGKQSVKLNTFAKRRDAHTTSFTLPHLSDDAQCSLQSSYSHSNIEEVELAAATRNDAEMHQLISALEEGKIAQPQLNFSIDQSEFSLQEDCLLRGTREHVPPKLKSEILRELHTAFFDMTRMI